MCEAIRPLTLKLRPGLLSALLLLALPGCQTEEAPPPGADQPQPVAQAAQPEGRPQPKLRTLKLWVGDQEVTAELAVTRDQIRTGMMFRTQMEEHEGMLFIFDRPHRASFYMRNTLLPLSCAYIDSDGVILEIHDMTPLDETPITASSDLIQYVLEMNQGWFERHGVEVGAIISTEHGSLGETFFRARSFR